MAYKELLPLLYNNHFYPSLIVKMKKNEEVIEGIEVYTSPLLKDRSIERVKEVVGETFTVSYMSTNESIQIVKKK